MKSGEAEYLPSLEQVHIVKLVELHSKLHRGLDFTHLGIIAGDALRHRGHTCRPFRGMYR